MTCLQTWNLGYRFEHAAALEGVDIAVPSGSIYGFLGPNGAGKTTTLRLMLGLLAMQQGRIELFGRPLREDRCGILRQIGSMIESPSFYDDLTARENLLLQQRIHRCPPRRIDEALELVGLASTGRKLAGRFSLGMKQRLGLAVALLHSPRLLILDEPTNGLDPGGIIEIRELLLRLNRDAGVTLLVSSHLLAEVEKLATHVGILHRGRLLFQGTIDDLRGHRRRVSRLGLRTSDDRATGELLHQLGHVASMQHDRLAIPALDDASTAALVRALVQAGIDIHEVARERDDLERIFMQILDDADARAAA